MSLKYYLIKVLHTIIWLVFVGLICFVWWCGLTGSITVYSWICSGIVFAEGLVLIYGNGTCPLTKMAAKYSDSKKANFDIYLPLWLAQYNKHIFTPLFLLGFLFMLVRYLHQLY